jgi:hypothetical protein
MSARLACNPVPRRTFVKRKGPLDNTGVLCPHLTIKGGTKKEKLGKGELRSLRGEAAVT